MSDRTATASRRAEPLAVWHARQMNNPASQFLAACDAAGVLPGLREAARWRRGEGEAIQAAWKLWPWSKTLPRIGAALLRELPLIPLSRRPEEQP